LKEEEKCDAVCVYVHYGKNKTPELASYQYTLAHGYIDAGADLVVGSHVHNVQGMEIYNGKPIYYNLGNFLFENYEVDTMVLNVKVNEDNSISTKITPCVSKQYFVQEVEGENAQKIYDYLESISVNVSVDKEGNVKEK
jgi:poly-gamma-glutamate synthesis protein (capsule biosynthesis protein)